MRTKVISIGNSRGVRIPKVLIEEFGLTGEVEIFASGCDLVLRPMGRRPREGWAEAAKELASAGEDGLLEGWDFPNKFDEEEWTWAEDL